LALHGAAMAHQYNSLCSNINAQMQLKIATRTKDVFGLRMNESQLTPEAFSSTASHLSIALGSAHTAQSCPRRA
jgi:hypothetical protein